MKKKVTTRESQVHVWSDFSRVVLLFAFACYGIFGVIVQFAAKNFGETGVERTKGAAGAILAISYVIWLIFEFKKTYQISKSKTITEFISNTNVLVGDFPVNMQKTLFSYFGNYISHLHDEDGEFMPRSEYMTILQRLACECGPFIGCSRANAKVLLKGKFSEEESRDQIIYDRFYKYNYDLSERAGHKYPTVRIFILTTEQIAQDEEIADKETGRNWWDLMVKMHEDFGFQISRIRLDTIINEYRQLKNQFSVFVTAGEGACIVSDKSEKILPNTACISFTSKFKRYGTICESLPAFSSTWYIDNDGHAQKSEKERIVNIRQCYHCSEKNQVKCKSDGLKCVAS